MSLALPTYFERPRSLWRGFLRKVASFLPKGLRARSILIVIAPMVILQSVLTYVFMERHWLLVTTKLSNALTQDIAAIIDIYQTYPQGTDHAALVRIAQESLTNTLRHAKANQFEVELCYNRRQTRLRLHDDGIGFDYQPGGGSAGDVTVPQANGISGGLGLLGIEERCRQLGGRVQIASSSTEGTTIEIIVPRQGLVWSFITSLFRRSPKNRQ